MMGLFEKIIGEGHPSRPGRFSHFFLFGTTTEVEVGPQAKCEEINLSAKRLSTLVVACFRAWGWLASSESSTRKKIAQSPLQSCPISYRMWSTPGDISCATSATAAFIPGWCAIGVEKYIAALTIPQR
jgi:hypothetical protein